MIVFSHPKTASSKLTDTSAVKFPALESEAFPKPEPEKPRPLLENFPPEKFAFENFPPEKFPPEKFASSFQESRRGTYLRTNRRKYPPYRRLQNGIPDSFRPDRTRTRSHGFRSEFPGQSRKSRFLLGSRSFFKGRMSKLVVQLSLLRIAEDRVCLRNLFKLLFCLRIPVVGIRMIFLCKFSICFLYRPFVRAFVDAQDLIIISFCCQNLPPPGKPYLSVL